MSTSVLSSVILIEKTVDAFLQPGFWKVLSDLLITAARAACSPWLVAEAFTATSHRTLPGNGGAGPVGSLWEWLGIICGIPSILYCVPGMHLGDWALCFPLQHQGVQVVLLFFSFDWHQCSFHQR